MSGLCLMDCQVGGIFKIVFPDDGELTGKVIHNYGSSIALATKNGLVVVSNDAPNMIIAVDAKTSYDWEIAINHAQALYEDFIRRIKSATE